MGCRFRFDVGIQEDFDNMTDEAGIEVTVQTRTEVLTHESQEASGSGYTGGTIEIAAFFEFNTEHQQVQSGEFKVGDAKFTFKSDSLAEEEGRVLVGSNIYKILKIDRVTGLVANSIVSVTAMGVKIDNR